MTHDQWVSMNTDGPDCPLAKVYSASDVQQLFRQSSDVGTEVRFFNRSHWPGIGRWLPADWLGDRWGWHRIVSGRKT